MRRRMPNRRQRRSAKKRTIEVKPKKGGKRQKDVLLITATFKGLYPNYGYMGKIEPLRQRIIKALESIHFRNVGVTTMSQKKVGKLKIQPKPKKEEKQNAKRQVKTKKPK